MKWDLWINGQGSYRNRVIGLEITRKQGQLTLVKGTLVGVSKDEADSIDFWSLFTLKSSSLSEPNYTPVQGRIVKKNYNKFTQQLEFTGYDALVKLDQDAGEEQVFSNVEARTVVQALKNQYKEVTDTSLLFDTSDSILNEKISFRISRDSILKLFAKLLSLIGASWYLSFEDWQNGYYLHEKVKIFVPGSISSASVSDSKVRGVSTSRSRSIINAVKVLGRGDGINQLWSYDDHGAGEQRAVLKTEISESATPPFTIKITKPASFPSSGDVWIGRELLHFDNRTSTDSLYKLHVTERGKLPGLSAYRHEKGIVVRPAYSVSYPHASSSIKKFGLQSRVMKDKSIIDQNCLDRYANRVIESHAQPSKSLTLETAYMDDYNGLPGFKLTYDEEEWIIAEIKYSEKPYPQTTLKAGQVYSPLLEEIKSIEREVTLEQAYGQGATNLYQVGPVVESIDSSKPFKFTLRIPEDAVAINLVRVSLKSLPWRSYEKVTKAGGQTTTEAGGGVSGTSAGSHTTSEIVSTFCRNDDMSLFMTTEVSPSGTIFKLDAPAEYDPQKHKRTRVVALVLNFSYREGFGLQYVRLVDDQTGQLIEETGEQTIVRWGRARAFKFSPITDSTIAGHRFRIEVAATNTAPCLGILGFREVEYEHTHSVTFPSHTHSIRSHTHDLQHGIYEGSSNNLYLKVNGHKVWSNISSKEGNLADYFEPGNNEVEVGLSSGSLGRFQFDAWVKCFVESR